MTRRLPTTRASKAGWFAAAAALLGTVAVLTKIGQVSRLRTVMGVRYDEESGRGRPATPPSPKARIAGHELRDMRGGLMVKLVLLLGAVAVCMTFAMVGLRYWVTQAQVGALPPLTRVQTTVILPPEPNLQRDPIADLANLRDTADKLLDSYGYVDEARTRARIPITRAEALMVGQPLAPPP